MKPRGQQIVHIVLTLSAGGDLDILPNVLNGEDLAVARELAEMVESFDYVNSIAFDALTTGKSTAVLDALRRRFSGPGMRSEMREAFREQIRKILQDGQVEEYLSRENGRRVASVKSRLMALDSASTPNPS